LATAHHLVVGEPVIDIPVQDHLAHWPQRELILRPRLGRVKRVKLVVVLLFNVHRLHEQVPHRELTLLNAVEEVQRRGDRLLRAKAGLHLVCLLVGERRLALLRLPVEFHVCLLASLVDHLECVHAEAGHAAVVERDAGICAARQSISTCCERVYCWFTRSHLEESGKPSGTVTAGKWRVARNVVPSGHKQVQKGS
jgi:hypothetical protein